MTDRPSHFKLKPCKCGNCKPKVTTHTVYRIMCSDCGAHTRRDDYSQAIILWNERIALDYAPSDT